MLSVFCPSGQEVDGGSCSPCDIGYYKNNMVTGIFSSCEICPNGFTTLEEGTQSVSGCNIGKIDK